MSEEKSYNGWKNYETWAMALWIDNDEGTYNQSREMAKDALEAHNERTGYGATAAGSLAHYLKEWQEEMMPEIKASVWSDLLRAAFSEVDWFEIAENYLEEVTENA